MPQREVTIPVAGGEQVSGLLDAPRPGARRRGAGLVLAHGAGTDQREPMLAAVARGLARRGHTVLRFDFLYRELGRKLPDRSAKLEQTYHAAVNAFHELAPGHAERLVLGGKSMGGRIASQLAVQGLVACTGLVFLGYPLHPAGKKTALRDKHLDVVASPMLFVQGTRDALCDLDLLRPVIARLGDRATLHVVEGGDHSLVVPKSHERSRESVALEVVDTVDGWLWTRLGAML